MFFFSFSFRPLYNHGDLSGAEEATAGSPLPFGVSPPQSLPFKKNFIPEGVWIAHSPPSLEMGAWRLGVCVCVFVLLNQVWISHEMYEEAAVRPIRHARHAERSRRALDEKTKQIIVELSMKLTNVSSAAQLFNVMVRYNHQYCDDSIIKGLESISVTRVATEALRGMKTYCNAITYRRNVQRREVAFPKKVSSEIEVIDKIFERNRTMKTDCKPQKKIVEFHPSPEALFIPRCASIKRCSGCCNEYHICRPSNIRTVKRKVVVIKVNQPSTPMKIKEIELEEHTSCQCTCENSAAQCSPHQLFDEFTCSCKCKNENRHCREPRRWNTRSCQCECPSASRCSTGYTRDPHSCKCSRSRGNNNVTYDQKKKKKRERYMGRPK